MQKTLIVAHARHGVIGHHGKLPWRMPADLQFFKHTTLGHHVVMGRKTFDHLPGPLPNRHMIVVTRQADYQPPFPCSIAHDLATAVQLAEQAGASDLFVAGGGEIYRQALPWVDRLLVTEVEAEVEGDTYFPAIAPEEWQKTDWEIHAADDKNPFPYTFIAYVRR